VMVDRRGVDGTGVKGMELDEGGLDEDGNEGVDAAQGA